MTADHAGQTGGEREVCDNGLAHYFDHGGVCIHCGHEDPSRAMSFDEAANTAEWIHAALPSRPVPVAGQAAREAAVEAVAEHVRHWLGDWMAAIRNDQKPTTTRTLARELLALDEVAALSAAPGQEPAYEWSCPSCDATTRARMADHPGQEREREDAAVDALMWAALTVEHSPGIKHQAKAVTAIRDRAAALRAAPGQEQP